MRFSVKDLARDLGETPLSDFGRAITYYRKARPDRVMRFFPYEKAPFAYTEVEGRLYFTARYGVEEHFAIRDTLQFSGNMRPEDVVGYILPIGYHDGPLEFLETGKLLDCWYEYILALYPKYHQARLLTRFRWIICSEIIKGL